MNSFEKAFKEIGIIPSKPIQRKVDYDQKLKGYNYLDFDRLSLNLPMEVAKLCQDYLQLCCKKEWSKKFLYSKIKQEYDMAWISFIDFETYLGLINLIAPILTKSIRQTIKNPEKCKSQQFKKELVDILEEYTKKR